MSELKPFLAKVADGAALSESDKRSIIEQAAMTMIRNMIWCIVMKFSKQLANKRPNSDKTKS